VEAVQTPARTVAYRRNPLQHRIVKILTVLGFAIPIVVFLWYLHHYGLNVVYGDQWDNVSLIGLSYKGKLTLSALWAQHNENRIFFPNLIALALSRVARFNVVTEQYVGAAFLFGALALMIGAHKRRCSNRTWLAYCPVVILMLSVVQGDNILSGFQIAWYLILVTLAGVLFILDRETISSFSVLASIALAIIGSFSSIQGLFIWVAGLMLLYYRRRSLLHVVTWIGAAAGTTAVYFYHFNFTAGVPTALTAPHLPSRAIQFFFQLIGDILGVPLTGNGVGADLVLGLGCLVAALALYTLWSFGRRRDTESAVPVSLALIVFGLLCALLTTYGRAWEGPPFASGSRYTTFDLLIVVGTYLTWIAFPGDLVASRRVPRRQVTARTVVPALLGGVILVQVPFGFVNGIRWARWDRQLLLTAAAVTVDINKLPDVVAAGELAPGSNPIALRVETRVLADHHLSFFADRQSIEYYRNQAAIDSRDGLFHNLTLLFPPSTIVLAPPNGSVVSGKTLLLASVRNIPNPRSVEFELTGNGGERILAAGHSDYGWILRWKSSMIPNGEYRLRTIVIGPAGQQTQSEPISITISN
jgi:hypothetical protein